MKTFFASRYNHATILANRTFIHILQTFYSILYYFIIRDRDKNITINRNLGHSRNSIEIIMAFHGEKVRCYDP